ncbi:MAG TPA: hypothetical protein VF401_02365 [Candidatus Saccharimonadales bacterium]
MKPLGAYVEQIRDFVYEHALNRNVPPDFISTRDERLYYREQELKPQLELATDEEVIDYVFDAYSTLQESIQDHADTQTDEQAIKSLSQVAENMSWNEWREYKYWAPVPPQQAANDNYNLTAQLALEELLKRDLNEGILSRSTGLVMSLQDPRLANAMLAKCKPLRPHLLRIIKGQQVTDKIIVPELEKNFNAVDPGVLAAILHHMEAGRNNRRQARRDNRPGLLTAIKNGAERKLERLQSPIELYDDFCEPLEQAAKNLPVSVQLLQKALHRRPIAV